MKKLCSLCVMLIFAMSSVFAAHTSVPVKEQRTDIQIISKSAGHLEFTYQVGSFKTMPVKSDEGLFTKILIPGHGHSFNYGMPELPVMNKLIEVPEGAKMEIEILNAEEHLVYLDEHGIMQKLMPSQPSLSKSQDPEDVPFRYNRSFYESGDTYSPETITLSSVGKMRGIPVSKLTICPFAYNPSENLLTVKTNIHVRVTFREGRSQTAEKAAKYSPHFRSVYQRLWNYEAPQNKDALSQYPIKYVIVADPMFETALQDFILWKTQKGYEVIEAYTDNPDVGNTTTSIHSYLQSLYEAGTASDPAPTYVLFVGDIGQIPAEDCGQHVSDMYYCEFDGGDDVIPEMYFGRFSATSVSELTPQIEKTLQFEKYTMPDPSYLEYNVLVAGVDENDAPTYGNGQINYGTTYYFNNAHGITPHTYLYPESDGDVEGDILQNINDGAGYVNYTAHCSSDGWGDPSFTISDIDNTLNNQDMYYVSVGNCCLSNKFDDPECYGEALLRRADKGAVAHLGGSNSTYWNEDYYWSVGLAGSIVADPTYEETGIGAYDAAFHENGEDPYITTQQMNYAGNLAVTEDGNATNTQYYWEIYHVMGDPSLMPYFGVPTALSVDYLDPQPIGADALNVTTEAGAYVAISIDGELLDAKLADGSGVAELSFDAIMDVTTADIVVTKQNRQPYIGTLEIIPNDNDYDVQLSAINAPESEIHISNATFSPEVQIRNLGQQNLTSASVNYQIDDEPVQSIAWTGDLELYATETVSFPEITLDYGNYNFVAWANEPNGNPDEFTANDTLSKDFTVYYGDVSLDAIISPQESYCNEVNDITPEIQITNNDAYALQSLDVNYSCGALNESIAWTGELAPGESTNISFTPVQFPEGMNNIEFQIANPNNGADADVSDNTASLEFEMIVGSIIQLDLTTDAWGSEVTWELTKGDDTEVLYSGGPYPDWETTELTADFCLSPYCYTFTIYDSYGDGMVGGWGSDPGFLSITNLDTEEVYGEIDGESYESSASIEFCTYPTNVADEDALPTEVYPNPSNGLIYISGQHITGIEILDITGRVILRNANTATQQSYDLSEYAGGMLFIKVHQDTQTYMEKVIISK